MLNIFILNPMLSRDLSKTIEQLYFVQNSTSKHWMLPIFPTKSVKPFKFIHFKCKMSFTGRVVILLSAPSSQLKVRKIFWVKLFDGRIICKIICQHQLSDFANNSHPAPPVSPKILLICWHLKYFSALETTEVVTVSGHQAILPCDLSPPAVHSNNSLYSVYLVLWYREDKGEPLYRL